MSYNAGKFMNILRAGAARASITPEPGIELAGYTPRIRSSNRSTAVHDPIWARALAIDDGEQAFILITLDLLGVELATTQKIRSKIVSKLSLPLHNILVCCTHNHSAPSLLFAHETHVRPDREWQESAIETCVETAVRAFAGLRPAEIGAGRATIEGVGANRKALLDDGTIFHYSGLYGRQLPPGRSVIETGPIDPELGVILLRSLDGEPIALLANYACHPWIFNGDRISSEISGACVQWLETHFSTAHPDLVALFTPGAGSNITTVQNQIPIPGGIPARESWYTEEWQRFGAILGKAALQAVAGIDSYSRTLSIDPAVLPLHAPAYEEKLSVILASRKTLPPPTTTLETELQVVRFGDRIVLVALPSEVYVEYGLEIKARSRFPFTMILTYCNDYFADLITQQAVEENCCPELEWTRVHPGAQRLIMEKLESIGVLHPAMRAALRRATRHTLE